MGQNKRGQVFLLGALLLIVILLGIISFSNKAVSSRNNYDLNTLARQIKGESIRVKENDMENGLNNLDDFIINISNYLKETYPRSNFLFSIGNSSNNYFYAYSPQVSDLIEIKNISQTYDPITKFAQTFNNPTGHHIIVLNEIEYELPVYSDINIYFAIEQEEDGEVFIGFA